MRRVQWITATCSSYSKYAQGSGGPFKWPFPTLDSAAEAVIPPAGTSNPIWIVINGDHGFQGTMILKSWSRNNATYASVNGQRTDFTSLWTMTIPATPANSYLSRVIFHATANGEAITTYRTPYFGDDTFNTDFPPAGGTYVYTPEANAYVEGTYHEWRALYQPEYSDYPSSDSTGYCPGVPMRHYMPSIELWFDDDPDDPPDDPEIEIDHVTDDEAELEVENTCEEAWIEYQEKDVEGHIDTAHQYTTGILTFTLTGLKADTWYWYRYVQICGGVLVVHTTYWFKTEATTDPLACTIVTLPATEVWSTGATIHGELRIAPQNNPHSQYLYMGFQYGTNSDVSGETIHWVYSGNYSSRLLVINHYPIQTTISGLLPDRTYYYRACLHVGVPPMTDNTFGSTLSFGGPRSEFGEGWEYVTAKKAEDDVSKLAVGRYYMDKSGNFVYESAKHRTA